MSYCKSIGFESLLFNDLFSLDENKIKTTLTYKEIFVQFLYVCFQSFTKSKWSKYFKLIKRGIHSLFEGQKESYMSWTNSFNKLRSVMKSVDLIIFCF